VAKPTLTGQSKRITRNAQGNLDSISLIPPPPTGDYPAIHPFTNLPLDVDGWHDLDAIIKSYTDDECRIIYVSSSEGTANGSTYTPSSFGSGSIINPSIAVVPFQTAAQALGAVRNGKADVMLFKRGDTWDHQSAGMYVWKHDSGNRRTGISPSKRMIVGAYGNPSAQNPTFTLSGGNTTAQLSISQVAGGANLIFAHLAFNYPTPLAEFQGAAIMSVIGDVTAASNNLIEGLSVSGHGKGTFVIQGAFTNWCVRRTVVANNYNNPWYFDAINGIWIEENICEGVGLRWRENNLTSTTGVRPQTFYIQSNCSNVTAIHNIISQFESTGIQMRPGGRLEGNLCIDGAMAYLNSGSIQGGAAQVNCETKNNMFFDLIDRFPGSGGGKYGVNGYTSPPVGYTYNVTGNIMSGYLATDQVNSTGISYGSGAQYANCVCSNNVVDGYPIDALVLSVAAGNNHSGLIVSGNKFRCIATGYRNGDTIAKAYGTYTTDISPVITSNEWIYAGRGGTPGKGWCSNWAGVNADGSNTWSASGTLWDTNKAADASFTTYITASLGLADRPAWRSAIIGQRYGNWNHALRAQNAYAWFSEGYGIN
jgi:hypothetical protein